MEDNKVNQNQQENYTEEKNRICYNYKESNQSVNKVCDATVAYGSPRKEQGSYTVEDYYANPACAAGGRSLRSKRDLRLLGGGL